MYQKKRPYMDLYYLYMHASVNIITQNKML